MWLINAYRQPAGAVTPAGCLLSQTAGRRAVNGAIGLFVQKGVIRRRCAFYRSGGRPAQRGMLLHDDDFTIVAKYQAEYARLGQYYLLAQDGFRLAACTGLGRPRC